MKNKTNFILVIYGLQVQVLVVLNSVSEQKLLWRLKKIKDYRYLTKNGAG
jgi:hypothetical protein